MHIYIGTGIYSTYMYMRMAGRWILLQYYDNNHWHVFILVDTIWKLHTFIAVEASFLWSMYISNVIPDDIEI